MVGKASVRWLSAALVIAVLGALLMSCTPQPSDDPFFTAPANKPGGGGPEQTPGTSKPGTLIRVRPSLFTQDPVNLTRVSGVDAYQVLYNSTSALGAPNTVSGTVLMPKKAWTGPGPRPLVTFGVGTRGLSDTCAPSWMMSTGWDYESAEYRALLARGWAVAITDMVGLATPGTHTYEVGREQGTAVLDIARAAQQIPELGLAKDGPIGIMGYSQGGTSAGWAAELAATYAPDLNIKGTVASGIPADLIAVAKALDGSPFVGLALLAAVGYDAAYPELDLRSYLNDRGIRMLDRATNMCIVTVDGIRQLVDVSNRRFSSFMKDKTRNPLEDPKWVARMNENRLGSVAPSAPVMQAHGLFDQMVAYPQGAELRQEWCARGANVTWQTLVFAEHVLGMVQSFEPSVNFLAARFADKPVKGNCPA
ncbi:MAG TPA: lipase family protein [Microthrixaceae bacterium]|nr:lipase family protein [Microthrixaceae bacterium]